MLYNAQRTRVLGQTANVSVQRRQKVRVSSLIDAGDTNCGKLVSAEDEVHIVTATHQPPG